MPPNQLTSSLSCDVVQFWKLLVEAYVYVLVYEISRFDILFNNSEPGDNKLNETATNFGGVQLLSLLM